jgi:cullin-4
MSLSSSNGVSTSSSRQLPSSVHHHRKRKHSSNQSSSHKQQKLSFSPVNKSKDRSPISSSESSTDMANQPPQRSISAPVGGVNGHKISLNNSHVLKGSVTNSNNRKSGQTKKIVIKNLKVRTDISEDYSQEAWRKLEESIAAIHTSCAISYSLEELYLAVENSCSHGMAPVLYENLKCQCQKYTASQLPEFNQDNVDEGTYLLVVNRIWESFCHQMVCYIRRNRFAVITHACFS